MMFASLIDNTIYSHEGIHLDPIWNSSKSTLDPTRIYKQKNSFHRLLVRFVCVHDLCVEIPNMCQTENE